MKSCKTCGEYIGIGIPVKVIVNPEGLTFVHHYNCVDTNVFLGISFGGSRDNCIYFEEGE